ncbi:hypothetical protein FACS1894184_19500 [Clostridia bacterium]|nr:hypothetical protein FACS1894184_19500 [Clostridia bacterium]
MREYCSEVTYALSMAIPNARVTRGWPKTLDMIPTIAVNEAGNLHSLFLGGAFNVDEVVLEIRIYAIRAGDIDVLAANVDAVMTDQGFDRIDARDENSGETRLKVMRYVVHALDNAGGGSSGSESAFIGIDDLYLAEVFENDSAAYRTGNGFKVGTVSGFQDYKENPAALYVDEVGKEQFVGIGTDTNEIILSVISVPMLSVLGIFGGENASKREYSMRYIMRMLDGNDIYVKYRSYKLNSSVREGYKRQSGFRAVGYVLRGAFGSVSVSGLANVQTMQFNGWNLEECKALLTSAEVYP